MYRLSLFIAVIAALVLVAAMSAIPLPFKSQPAVKRGILTNGVPVEWDGWRGTASLISRTTILDEASQQQIRISLENREESLLTIKQIVPSCGCLRVTVTDRSIGPGAEAKIVAQLALSGTMARNHQHLRVLLADGREFNIPIVVMTFNRVGTETPVDWIDAGKQHGDTSTFECKIYHRFKSPISRGTLSAVSESVFCRIISFVKTGDMQKIPGHDVFQQAYVLRVSKEGQQARKHFDSWITFPFVEPKTEVAGRCLLKWVRADPYEITPQFQVVKAPDAPIAFELISSESPPPEITSVSIDGRLGVYRLKKAKKLRPANDQDSAGRYILEISTEGHAPDPSSVAGVVPVEIEIKDCESRPKAYLVFPQKEKKYAIDLQP